jgi:hypothetical protein
MKKTFVKERKEIIEWNKLCELMFMNKNYTEKMIADGNIYEND